MTCAQPTPKFLATPTTPACWLARAIAAWRGARARFRQRRALAALDDRLLDDVGLSRRQAEAEVRKGFWEV